MAHASGHPVAIHCVTRTQLVLATTALHEARRGPGGDRIEHGAVIPAELIPRLRDLKVTVVTQPNFVAERGDDYLRSVEPDDLGNLWRGASLVRAGVAVAGGTDAPFGSPDPWSALRAATTRLTPTGRCLGADERVDVETALGWWTGTGGAPGSPRRVEVGGPADLVILGSPVEDVVTRRVEPEVVATVVAGTVIHP